MFCAGADNYKSSNHNCRKEQWLMNQLCNQKHFYEHYLQSKHRGNCDWGFATIDNAET